ncbi:hypothetical protein [Burkholderia thailandensis]|uniref:hypothetical protein n=1 Tax=Burkholderia thailandensis TaxID=57975 RepID=UPI00118530AB|nr:hypothetical protein [Burkholderia thailandensis]
MPKLFAFQGPRNCGKSATLIHLPQILQTKYPISDCQAFHSGTRDITVIMQGVNGCAVGIESRGDPNSRLQRSLSLFVAAKCDIIFCACRTSGMTVGWVNSLSPPYNVHFVMQNRVANNQGASNSNAAALLMRMAGI